MLNGNSLYNGESGRQRVILIADDDLHLRKLLVLNLELRGFATLQAEDGPQTLEMIREARPDLVILDIKMPGMNGLDVLRTVRDFSEIPIILATTEDALTDRVVGLELGADDYVSKPFSPRELVARVEAVLRRAQDYAPTSIELGGLKLDLESFTVQKNDAEPVALTMTEFQLLKAMAEAPGNVFKREQLLKQVWGYEEVVDTRALDFHIRSLRRKIEDDPTSPRLLRTVYGVGYRFAVA